MARKQEEVFEKLKEYVTFVTTQFRRKPTAIRSDQSGEYTGNELKKYSDVAHLKSFGSIEYLPIPKQKWKTRKVIISHGAKFAEELRSLQAYERSGEALPKEVVRLDIANKLSNSDDYPVHDTEERLR